MRSSKRITILSIASLVIIGVLFTIMAGCSSSQIVSEKDVRKMEEPTAKIDADFADLMCSEQQASRENMRRLAEGQIKSVTIDGVTKDAARATAKASCYYLDNSAWKADIGLVLKDKNWYLSSISRESAYTRPNPEPEKTRTSVMDVSTQIITEQRDHQDEILKLVNGQIKGFTIDKIDTGQDKTVLDITLSYADNTTLQGTIELLYSDGYWYLVKIAQKK